MSTAICGSADPSRIWHVKLTTTPRSAALCSGKPHLGCVWCRDGPRPLPGCRLMVSHKPLHASITEPDGSQSDESAAQVECCTCKLTVSHRRKGSHLYHQAALCAGCEYTDIANHCLKCTSPGDAGKPAVAARVLAGRGYLHCMAALCGINQAVGTHGRPQQEAQARAAQCLEGHPGPQQCS